MSDLTEAKEFVRTKMATQRLRNIVRRSGFDVVRFNGDLARHQRHLLERHAIDVVADVGANEGQYGDRLRMLGYRGKIVSFEPLPDAAASLRRRVAGDPMWSVHETAIGEDSGERELHVSRNSVSSSLLDMAERHIDAEPVSAYVGAVMVKVSTLDAYAGELRGRVWLKIDVQGGEASVLLGATSVLEEVIVLQAELSLVPLYDGAPTALELIAHLDVLGFGLIDIERVFTERSSGALLQMDGLFVRKESGRGR